MNNRNTQVGNDEIWKPILGFPGYEVSNLGRVRSFFIKGSHRISNSPQRILSGTKTTRYSFVGLYNNGKGANRYIHRLVASTFIGPCPSGMETCHLNGDCQDNRASNLCYDTHSNNEKAKFLQGKSSTTEFAEADVIAIRTAAANGTPLSDLAIKYQKHRETIKRMCLGKTFEQIGGPRITIQQLIQKRLADLSKYSTGEKNVKAKLSSKQVDEIRLLAKHGLDSRKELAARFNVTPPTISKILLRQTWKHI